MTILAFICGVVVAGALMAGIANDIATWWRLRNRDGSPAARFRPECSRDGDTLNVMFQRERDAAMDAQLHAHIDAMPEQEARNRD